MWPFDNSIIALGLRNYGFKKEAAQVALANLEAARYFQYRLPEAFAGYHRAKTAFPVEYQLPATRKQGPQVLLYCFCARS